MTKFQKVQKFSGIIPFWSTIFVASITLFELKKQKAPLKIWIYFILTFLLSGAAVYFLNAVILTGRHLLLNVLASSLVLAAANILFVDFQVMCPQREQEKNKINSAKVVIICCVVALAVGIGVLCFTLLLPAVDIEDINGSANTNLAVITAEEVLATENHYSAISSYTLQKGTQSAVRGNLEDYDYQECSFSCKKVSGIMTLQATNTSRKQLALEISSQLEAGNMEIIIIIDGEYYDHFPINQTGVVVLPDVSNKTVVVKIAAESAKLSISVKRTECG